MRATTPLRSGYHPLKNISPSVTEMEKNQQTTIAGFVKFQTIGQISAQNLWQ